MIGKLDDYLRFNQLALDLRAQRQQVLASNIANADTPNYKARDFDFSSALQSAMARANQPGDLARTQPSHLPPSGNTLPDGTPLLYRQPAQASVDANTVDMDVERNQFADNALRYQAGVSMVNIQIKEMLLALQGGN